MFTFETEIQSQRQKERLTIGVFPVLIPLLVLGQPLVRLGAHGLSQVSEGLGIRKINLLKHKTKPTARLPGTLLPRGDAVAVVGSDPICGKNSEIPACVLFTHLTFRSKAWQVAVLDKCFGNYAFHRETPLVFNKATADTADTKAPIQQYLRGLKDTSD